MSEDQKITPPAAVPAPMPDITQIGEIKDGLAALLKITAVQAEEARKKARPRLIRAWEWFAENNAWVAWILVILLITSTALATYQWRKAVATSGAANAQVDTALQRAIGANAEKAKVVKKESAKLKEGKLIYGTFEDADAAFKEEMERSKSK